MSGRETCAQAYQRGHIEGYQKARQELATKEAELIKRYDIKREQLALMKSVAELVSAASQAVNGLGQTYDTGPRP